MPLGLSLYPAMHLNSHNPLLGFCSIQACRVKPESYCFEAGSFAVVMVSITKEEYAIEAVVYGLIGDRVDPPTGSELLETKNLCFEAARD